jgi:hypothetical protein
VLVSLAATLLLMAGLLASCGAGSALGGRTSPRGRHEAAVGTLSSCAGRQAAPPGCPPSEISLVVLPHPDDEISAWSMIENTPSDYKVFVDLTQGESIGACDPRIGPSIYERTPNVAGQMPGSDPPGGQYMPGVDPWVGTIQEQLASGQALPSPGCRQARFGSQASFLTKESAFDPSVPSFSSSEPPTEWCFASEPNGKDPCLEVLANQTGAIVSFDLGDMDWCESEIDCAGDSGAVSGEAETAASLGSHPYALQESDVAWAVQNLARYASTLLPVSLPIGKVIAGGFLNLDGRFGTRWDPTNTPAPAPAPPEAGTCGAYGQPQHWATDTAIRNWTLVPGVPQYGRTCSGDHYAIFQNIDETTYRRLLGYSDATALDGEWPTSYGWMDEAGLDPPGGANDPMEVCDSSLGITGLVPAEGITSCDQAFWEVERPVASVDYTSPTPPQVDPQGPWDYSKGNWKA